MRRTSSSPLTGRFLVSTTESLPGHEVEEVLGSVSAADVRAVNILQDIWAALVGIFGGEAVSYSTLVDDSTKAAMERCVRQCRDMGADGMTGMRIEMATTMNRLIVGLHSGVVCYGTAVRVKRRPIASTQTDRS